MRNFITIVENFDASLGSRAVDLFGVTDNPFECGYILADGTMLDFSGRHAEGTYERVGNSWTKPAGDRDFMQGKRFVDHGDLDDLADDRYDFMAKTGAIRVSPGFGFEFITDHVPTRRQVRAICDLSAAYQTDIYLEISDPLGRPKANVLVNQVTPRDISKLFDSVKS